MRLFLLFSAIGIFMMAFVWWVFWLATVLPFGWYPIRYIGIALPFIGAGFLLAPFEGRILEKLGWK
jgi:hypothetical protein